MRYGSVCSGIEAASVAWIPLGWEPAFFAEIEPFCCALLKQKHPSVKNYGDFTTIGSDAVPIDILVGGTPCQDFSIAGLRAGMDGSRGNLTLEFVKLAGRLRPQWLVWENVPGVLSIDGGRAFGAFLGGLAELGHGFAYRILDAQHFGVPQRRRRVFVVGYLGDWRPAAAVLFERESLCGYPPPRREAGKGFTHDLAPSLTGSGRGVERGGESRGQDPVIAMCLNAKGGGGRIDGESETFVTHSLDAISAGRATEDGTGRVDCQGDATAALTTMTDQCSQFICIPDAPAIAFQERGREGGRSLEHQADLAYSLNNPGAGGRAQERNVLTPAMAVRRLTPRECERLQGFPDDYTAVTYRGKPPADGPRYRALGNSMAVPCMAWIGRRIQEVEDAATEAIA